ncbi:TIGR02996 domain-containing protein, partial [Pyxidicoccus sp. 3LFB2]
MSTYQKLVARIAAEPDNDEPRLVCADVLRGTDDARADLIQAQVALRGRLDPARRRALQLQEAGLLTAHAGRWKKPLEALRAPDVRFSRGFMRSLSLSEEQLATHGGQVLALEPVHRLTVTTRDGQGAGAGRRAAVVLPGALAAP